MRLVWVVSSQNREMLRQWVPVGSRRWLGTVLVLVGLFLVALEGLNLTMPVPGVPPGGGSGQPATWVHWALFVGGGIVAVSGAWIVLNEHSQRDRHRDQDRE